MSGTTPAEGQRPPGVATIPALLKKADRRDGRLREMGPRRPGTTGPNRQGFDHFYGYLCQRLAHNYYRCTSGATAGRKS
jgi:hypothetical protein